MIHTFSADSFQSHCDLLAKKDKHLRGIIKKHGYPPMWTRKQGFETLILTILEQQVSLASAFAAYKKLKSRIGVVTPAKILAMSNEELRECYFTRQKQLYAKELATAIVTKQLQLKKFPEMTDEDVRTQLTAIKGIGNWTTDVYLMHALQRTDLFPLGDIALVNSLKETKQLHPHVTKDEMLTIAEPWRPYRTIAAMILWHAYIKKRNIKIEA
ncbi:DNA-3-methyladenine glycosylase 2 family protein [Lacibacter luteus]|uniref:DNA-3-methyladenine glycosylase II n=1 Tax=Lacibacter luteus TaxID=2508719 RepID=A0A4Q1CIQ1_9BACT|nr:DNA-3-methyladenine glycosylase [Lacibacter luteus]RXK60490.1 DNA-3-methyladenine glycosylase 2 family protein [Lacibacter luteus]